MFFFCIERTNWSFLKREISPHLCDFSMSVPNLVGRVLLWVSWVLKSSCHREYFKKIFSWVFPGSKFFFSRVFHGCKYFSCGCFVGLKFFSWVFCGSNFFSWVFRDSKIVCCWLHEEEWQKAVIHKYISTSQTAYYIPHRFHQLSVLLILERYFIY